MDDLISRAAAIGAINDLQNCYNGYSDAYDKSCIIGLLEELPAAQQEIIRCRDCVKRETCRTTNIWAVAPNDDWFCGDAERRTDE